MSVFSRRRFLSHAAAAGSVLSLSGRVPGVLLRAADQAADRSDDRILVVVELAGGNDGLNTVVPFRDEAYRRARPTLAVPAEDVIPITDRMGLHPALSGLGDVLDANRMAIVQGVGYDRPNRSHFESMDIWHTCQRKDQDRPDGWLGRFAEEPGTRTSDDPVAMHIGHEQQPYALMSRNVALPSLQSLEEFRLRGTEKQQFREAVRELTAARSAAQNDLLGFVQSTSESAVMTSERVAAAAMQSGRSGDRGADTDLSRRLKIVAQLIDAGLRTKVYYVRLDGFDTHANQGAAHAGLLRTFGDAVSMFLKELGQSGHADRVLVMSFSEFGRRVGENASEGTDHGTAGPMFLFGPGLKPGLFGSDPDLTDLQDGDLKHGFDFRQVYATVMRRWFACPSETVLAGSYEPLELMS